MQKARLLFSTALFVVLVIGTASAQTTEFTYQGSLKDGASAASGTYDLEFALFDSSSGGNQIGATLDRSSVTVTGGIFSVKLDFGNQFPGADRFLEIRVRTTGQPSFTILSPRQTVNSSPYAVRSVNSTNAQNAVTAQTATSAQSATTAQSATSATTATNSLQLGGIVANQYVRTDDNRLSDARNPLAGSPNYVQNSTSPQANSNFNVSGNGTAGGILSANTISASTQFNIGSNRILSVGNNSIFARFGAGQSNTTGAVNSFFGVNSGLNNTTGFQNVFIGAVAGFANTTGANNTFVGSGAGDLNTTANANAFFGENSGQNNSTGSGNSFAGSFAGVNNSSGGFNSFFGNGSGDANTGGISNTALGSSANFSSGNLVNASAIGANAMVTQDSSLVLGSINGINDAISDTNVGIGTTAPSARLHVVGNGLFTGNLTVNGTLNASLPAGSSSYIQNSAIQQASSSFNVSGNGVVGGILNSTILEAGGGSPSQVVLGSGAIATGSEVKFINLITPFFSIYNNPGGTGRLTIAETSNSLGLGFAGTPLMSIVSGGNVGIGTTSPSERIHVAGNGLFTGNLTANSGILGNSGTFGVNGIAGGVSANFGAGYVAKAAVWGTSAASVGVFGTSDSNVGVVGVSQSSIGVLGRSITGNAAQFEGTVVITSLGTGGSGNPLCRNASNQISNCSSSFRYKTNIGAFKSGLDLIKRFHPITFDWKDGGMHDLGLGAEDVAKIEPLLVTHNDQGQIEGVKYDRIAVVLINAVKEQQAEIERERAANRRMKGEIDALKALVCSGKRRSAVCGRK